jgi:beta-lactamase superfamily II metal-dependent hydrolase
VQAARPDVVIFSVGRANQFHQPHKTVLRRYEEVGSRLLSTELNGTITVEVNKAGEVAVTKTLP